MCYNKAYYGGLVMGEYFTCAQFVAGALLKFDSIDSIDISILLQDIKEKLGIECDRSWNIHYENDVLKRVIESLVFL